MIQRKFDRLKKDMKYLKIGLKSSKNERGFTKAISALMAIPVGNFFEEFEKVKDD